MASNNVAIAAAKAATPTIPIVMVYGDDPVRQGYIASLADRVATLPAEPRSSLRRLRRFMGREWSRWWNAAVRSRGSPFVDPNDPSSGQGSGEAIQIIGGPFMYSARAQIAEMAMQHGLPTAYPWRAGPEAGGLLSCGMNLPAAWRRVTVYVDKILKGAKPADLPVEQPTSSNWSSTSGPPRPSA
jgi:putative ABC transport system substrate-binding protein